MINYFSERYFIKIKVTFFRSIFAVYNPKNECGRPVKKAIISGITEVMAGTPFRRKRPL